MQQISARRSLHRRAVRSARTRRKGPREDARSAFKQDAAGAARQAKPFAGRWRGSTCVCIASGPSLNPADCALVGEWRANSESHRVIAVNNSFALAPFADVIFAMDRHWWNVYGADIETDAECWTSSREAAQVWDLHYAPAPDETTHGGNSGFQAVRLALDFGCDRIVLLGYDMCFHGGRRHWHDDHDERKGVGNPLESSLKKWRNRLELLGRGARAEIVNATRSTALKCFRRVSLVEALCERG
jgi:hypothetical protein